MSPPAHAQRITPNDAVLNALCINTGDTTDPTGLWAEEVASPYFLFKAAGYAVDITSIAGGEIPFGEKSCALCMQ